jgi:signal transduction histidine kinase
MDANTAQSPMTVSPCISPGIRRALLFAELTLLGGCAWVSINSVNSHSSPFIYGHIALFCVLITPFIFVMPIDRPLWQRRAYIILAICLIVAAFPFDVFFDSLIFTFLLEGCFLLPRREVIFVAAVSALMISSAFVSQLPQEIAEMRSDGMKGIEEQYNDPRIFSNIVIAYGGACTFIVLLGNVWAEEQKTKRRAELLTQQVETLAADLERNRIARDIHDSLGHSLTSLDVQIELAQRLQLTDPERSRKSLDTAKQLTSQSLEDVRRALRTMQQSHFDLKEATIALSEQVNQNQTFHVQTDIQLPPLSLQTSYQIYCIIQESLTNIQKHAHASQVILKLALVEGGATLYVLDDGSGFDPSLPHTGFGLRSMKERVQNLGGKFHLYSELGQGTHIEIFVPTQT